MPMTFLSGLVRLWLRVRRWTAAATPALAAPPPADGGAAEIAEAPGTLEVIVRVIHRPEEPALRPIELPIAKDVIRANGTTRIERWKPRLDVVELPDRTILRVVVPGIPVQLRR